MKSKWFPSFYSTGWKMTRTCSVNNWVEDRKLTWWDRIKWWRRLRTKKLTKKLLR